MFGMGLQERAPEFTLQPMRIPSRPLAVLALSLAITAQAPAQSGTDGTTLQQSPGLALIKPQPWSKESEAALVEFTAYVDRSATGHGASGYYEFHFPSGQKRQYPVSKVFRVVIYPDPERVQNLVSPEDRSAIEKTIDEVRAVIARFPATKSYLEPPLQNFGTLLQKYDAGQVKTAGKWLLRQRYTESEAARLADMLKIEITQAQPPGSTDLENDPKFLALVEMSKSAPKVKTFVLQLRDMHSKLVRGERRKKLLAQLADPSLPLPTCQNLVEELAALDASEDPASKKALDRWQSAFKEAATLAAGAEAIAGQLDAQLSSVADVSKVPTFTGEPASGAAGLADKVKKFQATAPPAQFTAEVAKATAVVAVYEGFAQLQPLIAGQKFLDAKDVLDDIAPRAPLVGPHSVRVVGEFQRSAAARIEIFTRAREEAKMLADGGKVPEALAKYQEAFSVIPDPSVASIIDQLKQPAATP